MTCNDCELVILNHSLKREYFHLTSDSFFSFPGNLFSWRRDRSAIQSMQCEKFVWQNKIYTVQHCGQWNHCDWQYFNSTAWKNEPWQMSPVLSTMTDILIHGSLRCSSCSFAAASLQLFASVRGLCMDFSGEKRVRTPSLVWCYKKGPGNKNVNGWERNRIFFCPPPRLGFVVCHADLLLSFYFS